MRTKGIQAKWAEMGMGSDISSCIPLVPSLRLQWKLGIFAGKLNSYNIAIGEDPNAWSSSLANPTDFGGLQQDEQQERRISALVDPE